MTLLARGAFLVAIMLPTSPALAADDVVIPAEKAAVKTVGAPVQGGWNLFSDGRVGQTLRFQTPGTYHIVVRAWGSPAGGIWPEMVLLVDRLEAGSAQVVHAEAAGYPFDVDLASGSHEIAAGFTNDALIGREDRNLYLERIMIVPPAGAVDPVLTDGSELRAEAEEREREIVASTTRDIAANRMAEALVRVEDAAGRPVHGASVSVAQTGHEFLFGCNIYGFDHARNAAENAAYKARFAELFNYATVGFYWRCYEPERGKPHYAETDTVVAWCREHGIRLKGHPLLWGDRYGIPPWSNGQPAPDVQRQRLRDILTRYHDHIGFYEVVNEPSHQPLPTIDDPYRWAREADPSAYLIVNDYHVLADGAPGFYRLLQAANRDGVPYDGIGIQAHEPRTARFPLDRVQTILDKYATLGKELHITEFTPASGGESITDSHLSGAWDEAAQADYAVKFYRVAFAHPAVRAITWWDLSDQNSWLPGGGLLRSDMSPKPAYEQLLRLIHEEWWTRETGETDAAGRYAFRGFRGTYTVKAQVRGEEVECPMTLAKDRSNTITIRLVD
jgi:GH35 family endo-1,4-beta-xylanase